MRITVYDEPLEYLTGLNKGIKPVYAPKGSRLHGTAICPKCAYNVCNLQRTENVLAGWYKTKCCGFYIDYSDAARLL